MILLLDDDTERLKAFEHALRSAGFSGEIRTWNSSHAFIRDWPTYLEQAELISLDHDLFLDALEGEDLGDGYAAAQALATYAPQCPVIIHTSNAERGRWMQGALESSGWACHRVLPLGDDWIKLDWLTVVNELI